MLMAMVMVTTTEDNYFTIVFRNYLFYWFNCNAPFFFDAFNSTSSHNLLSYTYAQVFLGPNQFSMKECMDTNLYIGIEPMGVTTSP
jgi:hypothetical protein